jgi:hypothetical protein
MGSVSFFVRSLFHSPFFPVAGNRQLHPRSTSRVSPATGTGRDGSATPQRGGCSNFWPRPQPSAIRFAVNRHLEAMFTLGFAFHMPNELEWGGEYRLMCGYRKTEVAHREFKGVGTDKA